MNMTYLARMTTMMVFAAAAGTGGHVAGVDPVTTWSETALAAAQAARMPPLRLPITLAMVHLAMLDAVTAAGGGRDLYAARPRVKRPASPHAAAVEAGYVVLLAEFPGEHARLSETRGRLLATIPESVERNNGLELGGAAARDLLVRRRDDGRNAMIAHGAGAAPGAWRPTPPAFQEMTTAFLAHVTPFVLNEPSQVRPEGPPPLTSRRWAADFGEVKTLGRAEGSLRTSADTATARFWEPLAGTVWTATIRRLARDHALDLEESARFQAAAFAAFADSLIACWDAKVHFNTWRPITAIAAADTDGNARTDADPDWGPLGVTPNFPEYPSGHACASAAVSRTIEHYFRARVPIPARNVVTGEERWYRSARPLIAEVVEARMLLGVHFRHANEDGAEIGQDVADLVRRRFLKR
jgi:hypothetical protein